MRDSGIHDREICTHLGMYTMPPTSNVNDLARRLRKLEGETRSPRHLPVRVYAMEGPKNLPPGAAEAFLRGCGHAFDADHHNIIRIMVAADRDLPMKDLTDRYGREPCVPASALHMQHGRG